MIEGVADAFRDAVLTGPMLVAAPVAAAAGLVSFLSPCVLPLVPGYLSYVTGLGASDLAGHRRGRMIGGALLFVLGFTAVFVGYGLLFGGLGEVLVRQRETITRVLGALVVVMGLLFAGWLPGLSKGWRLRAAPQVGLAGAPVLGVLFGLGWTPCFGPTLVAVQALAVEAASAGRGAALSAAYCLGLGLPFLLFAAGYRRALGASAWVNRHQQWIMRVGGLLLVAMGLLLVTGLWDALIRPLQRWVSGFEVVV